MDRAPDAPAAATGREPRHSPATADGALQSRDRRRSTWSTLVQSSCAAKLLIVIVTLHTTAVQYHHYHEVNEYGLTPHQTDHFAGGLHSQSFD